jgi:hypothetical protein
MRVASLLVLLFLAVLAPSARAGTYDVTLCADPAATGFTAHVDDANTLTATATCPATGLYVGVVPGLSWPAAGATAAWTLTAPPGTTFRSLSVERTLERSVPAYEVAVVTDEGLTIDGCLSGTCNNTGAQTYDGARAYAFRVRCDAATACANSPGAAKASLLVRKASATVEDAQPPTVALTAPGGWLRAVPPIAVSATDNTGVRTVVMRDGGQTLATRNEACDFRHLQPCATTVSASFTPPLSDGAHSLTAIATDAAGEATTSVPVTVKIDSSAPGAPLDLAIQKAPDGRFVYTWRNPDQARSPIVAAHLSDGTVVKGANLTSVTAGASDLKVYLEDEAGNADPATAVGSSYTPPVAIGVQKPILRPAGGASAKLRISSAKRSGNRVTVKGTIARDVTARLTATLARGKRSVKATVKPRGGRFTVRLKMTSPLRRRGTNTLTVRFGGQGDFVAASVSKKLAVR